MLDHHEIGARGSSRIRVVASRNHDLAGLHGAADLAFDLLLPARAPS